MGAKELAASARPSSYLIIICFRCVASILSDKGYHDTVQRLIKWSQTEKKILVKNTWNFYVQVR